MKKCFWEDREVYKFHNYVNNLATSKMNLHSYSQGSQRVYNRFLLSLLSTGSEAPHSLLHRDCLISLVETITIC